MTTNPRPTMVFGVDLDSVVGDYVAAFRRSVAEFKGLDPVRMGEPPEWDFCSAPGWEISSKQEYLDLHQRAVQEHHLFRWMPAYNGASETLWRLSDAGVRVKIVTHRLVANGQHEKVVADTVSWLESNRIPYRDLCFVADKAASTADIYVDDAPHNITALREAHGPDSAVVFDQPYNRHLSGLRVTNWAQLGELVLERQISGGFNVEPFQDSIPSQGSAHDTVVDSIPGQLRT
jgi:5'-nucleotidase